MVTKSTSPKNKLMIKLLIKDMDNGDGYLVTFYKIQVNTNLTEYISLLLMRMD